MTLPKISSYGKYASSNYGNHTKLLSTDKYDLYYSYTTIVAFHIDDKDVVVRQNDWGVTTGKHLNWIDGGNKKARIPSVQFEAMLRQVLE